MGLFAFDQYSLLHFAVGIITYFFNISFYNALLIHILFEYIENTLIGMKVINNYLTFWPGGKPYQDSTINTLFDNVFFSIGWLLAYYMDKWSTEHHLYPIKI